MLKLQLPTRFTQCGGHQTGDAGKKANPKAKAFAEYTIFDEATSSEATMRPHRSRLSERTIFFLPARWPEILLRGLPFSLAVPKHYVAVKSYHNVTNYEQKEKPKSPRHSELVKSVVDKAVRRRKSGQRA